MDKVLNFLADNYILLMVIGVVLLIALIGFVVEGKKKKKDEGTIDNSQSTPVNNVNTLNTDTNVVNNENAVNTDVNLNTNETKVEPTLNFGTPNTNQTEVTQDNNVNNGLNAGPVTLEAQTEMPVNDVNAQVVPNIVESEPTALDFGTPANTVNEPVVSEPVVNQPVVNEPVVNEPVVSEPVNNMYNNAQVVQENVVDFGNTGVVNTPSNASEPAVLGGEMPVNNQTVNATSTTQVVNNAPASETPQVATIEIPTIEPVNVDTNNDQTPLV